MRQQALLDSKDDELQAKQSTIETQAEKIAYLEEWKRLIYSQRFASKSEKASADQFPLFNEAEAEAVAPVEETEDDTVSVPAHTRKKRGRKPLPEFLPVREVVHDLSDEEKVCPHDVSHMMKEIGRESSDQLEFIPARVEIVRNVRPKYACPACKEGVSIAPMPPTPVPKSIATPFLLAQVATSKYVDGLPLYRQEKIFERLGLDLSRARLGHWMVKMGDLVDPLVDRIKQEIRAYDLVQCGETPFQVLKEPGKTAQSQSHLWTLRGGPQEHPLIYYEYDPSRSGEVPKRLLRGFEGFLQTDGYEGDTAIGREPNIVHVGCWAHARRRFDEALRGQKSKSKNKKKLKKTTRESVARQAMDQIQALYRIEKKLKDALPEKRHRVRQVESLPLVGALREWLDDSLDRVAPQSLTGKAMAYLDRQWLKLVRVFEDGRIALGTNRVENVIRPFVLGRKNWLFADTTAGARASANLFGLIETAKANGIEPRAYLRHVFDALPRATSPEEVEALLPQNVDPALIRHTVAGT